MVSSESFNNMLIGLIALPVAQPSWKLRKIWLFVSAKPTVALTSNTEITIAMASQCVSSLARVDSLLPPPSV